MLFHNEINSLGNDVLNGIGNGNGHDNGNNGNNNGHVVFQIFNGPIDEDKILTRSSTTVTTVRSTDETSWWPTGTDTPPPNPTTSETSSNSTEATTPPRVPTTAAPANPPIGGD